MNPPDSHVILQRILAYWQWAGMPLDRDTELKALAITRQALQQHQQLALEVALQAARAALPASPATPQAGPPLRRGSLRYGDY
ncbi:hypothetical protein CNQ84_01180 [Pseudomonas abyssi]|jgi:hypothetical protein|uniref:Uncharacterized protein n=1 Tax=Pseudomonas abyssi TaxID=170540 RepID=A0A2A3MMI7_9PSED|nr:hypothetical protein [Pseudomonas abyssi]MAC98741.1 hypothetical protein [Pseudomonadales bacterium]PBK06018.1 hypothetical protein CNQ84_01180 [Pseudomonas abyssi]|tara:strand:+ start:10519 stop:10767 length:249 start_codon:yes stop_codon:yes gene_type:complete